MRKYWPWAVLALIVVTVILADVLPDGEFRNMDIQGQTTLNSGQSDQDAMVDIDLTTDQSFGWDEALAAASLDGFYFSDNLVFGSGAEADLTYFHTQSDNALSAIPVARYVASGNTFEMYSFQYDFNIAVAGAAPPNDGQEVTALHLDSAQTIFGPESGTYNLSFGHASNTSDTATFNAKFTTKDKAVIETSSTIFTEWRTTGGAEQVIAFMDGTSGTTTTQLGDIYSDGTDLCYRWNSLGTASPEIDLCRSGTNELTLDADLVVETPHVLQGDRQTICAGDPAIPLVDFLSLGNVTTATTRGIPMPRAGSVIGLSGNCNISAHSTNGTLTIYAYVNTATVDYQTASATITGNGDVGWSGTQARDTDQFAAGGYISMEIGKTGGLIASVQHCIGCVEVIYDD